MSHKYSKEILHHFKCEHCGQWWTIGDWQKSYCYMGELSCPNCGEIEICEEIV